jgi:hypothetical protein
MVLCLTMCVDGILQAQRSCVGKKDGGGDVETPAEALDVGGIR